MLVGMDYGSRKAGTTVICYQEGGLIRLIQSVKNEDADHFLSEFLNSHSVDLVAIDAPLSLPRVYQDQSLETPDFHFRHCDREAGAMSPLFLGGLTARAIDLRYRFKHIPFIEAYPKLLARHHDLISKGYKKEKTMIDPLTNVLSGIYSTQFIQRPSNWHQFDALLAYLTGTRFQKNEAIMIGDPEEGLIYC